MAVLPAAIAAASASELRRVGPTTIYNLITHARGDDADTTQNIARHLAGQLVARDCVENSTESRCLRYVLQCVEKADWAVGRLIVNITPPPLTFRCDAGTRAEAMKVLVEASMILAGRDGDDSGTNEAERPVGFATSRTRRRMGLRELEKSGQKSNRWSQGGGRHGDSRATKNRFVAQWMPLFVHPILAYSQSKRCTDQPVLLAECLRTSGQLLQSAAVSARNAPHRKQVVDEVSSGCAVESSEASCDLGSRSS